MKQALALAVVAFAVVLACGADPTPPPPPPGEDAGVEAPDAGADAGAIPPDASIPTTQQLALSVTEADGFTPTPATVYGHVPLTLTVTRKTNNTCATSIVIPQFNVNKQLPLNQPVVITFTPGNKPIDYACQMNMIRGVINVK